MDEPGGKVDDGMEKTDQETVVAPERSFDMTKKEVLKSSESSESPELPKSDGPPHPHEELMDDYPLREPTEDPVWSVRIVKGWMWFLAFTTGGILLLIVLGFFYD
jgi:hypothetical protein